MKFTIFVIKFLLLGAFFIISNQNLALAEEGNMDIFWGSYADWLYGVAGHLGDLTGYIVGVEWLPDTEDKENLDSLKSLRDRVKR